MYTIGFEIDVDMLKVTFYKDLIENSKSFSEEDNDTWANDVKALKMAIETLEKQIPKEPLNREERSEISYGYCPCCSNIIDDWNDLRYCGECGQAIKWEETE